MRDIARKSVVAVVHIPRGQPVTREMLGVRRPGTGIPPSDLERLIGRAHCEDIPAGSLLRWETTI
jgi:sialic acid synthase SpsE